MLLSSHQRKRAREGQLFAACFDTPEGKTVLNRLLVQCGMLSTSMQPGDPQVTAFNEGRRSIGLYILDQLRWSEMEMVALASRRTEQQIEDAEGE